MKNTLNSWSSIENQSEQKVDKQIITTKENIATIITVDITETTDIEELVKWHPAFTKHNFTQKDIVFLKEAKSQLSNDNTLSTLQKIVKSIPKDRTDLAEGILFLYGRINA